jgi:hypothetical protein
MGYNKQTLWRKGQGKSRYPTSQREKDRRVLKFIFPFPFQELGWMHHRSSVFPNGPHPKIMKLSF